MTEMGCTSLALAASPLPGNADQLVSIQHPSAMHLIMCPAKANITGLIPASTNWQGVHGSNQQTD